MKKTILLLLPGIAASAVPAMADDCQSLWNKVVALFDAETDRVPGRVVSTMKILNKKGEIENTTVMEMRQYIDEQGVLQSEITRVIEDGKDIAEAAGLHPNDPHEILKTVKASQQSFNIALSGPGCSGRSTPAASAVPRTGCRYRSGSSRCMG